MQQVSTVLAHLSCCTKKSLEVTIEAFLLDIVNDPNIKVKILEGGLYAVTCVKRNANKNKGNEIMMAWDHFRNWISDSKYAYGGHQWLEEHLGFDDNFNHIGGVDLYMPIKRSMSYGFSTQSISDIT